MVWWISVYLIISVIAGQLMQPSKHSTRFGRMDPPEAFCLGLWWPLLLGALGYVLWIDRNWRKKNA